MIGNSISQNYSGGPWDHLVKEIVPQWIAGDFGLEWVTPPRPQGVTNRFYFEISNKFGGVSRMYLDSLDSEDQAEKRFKSKYMSLIHWTELSNFKQRATFDVLKECLRTGAFENQQMIAETNPAEEGDGSWIYKLWYVEPFLDLENVSEETLEYYNLLDADPEEVKEVISGLRERQSLFDKIEVGVDDNPFITPSQKRTLRAEFQGNPDLLARYWRGEWRRSSGTGYFKEVINADIHFLGDAPTPLNPEPDYVLPDENSVEIGVGFDIGGSKNTSITFFDKVMVEVAGVNGALPGLKPHFRIIDEFAEIGVQQDVERIGEALMKKAEFWEGVLGRSLYFDCWSDSSSFQYNMLAASTEATEIFRLTGGKFNLKSVADDRLKMHIKGSGNAIKGVDLIRRLLFEKRLVVSRAKCPQTIDMLTGFSPGKNGKMNPGDPLKHLYDSARYYLLPACWMEMQQSFRHRTKNEVSRVLVTSL